ncbi:MAG: helix-turn-helix domain-containing protein [Thermomicrobiales bacterium]
MSSIHIQFGKAVRTARLSAGLSQEALATKAGIHRTYVSSVELGKVRIGLEVAHRLAAGLGVPLNELIAAAESNSVDDST